MLLWLSSQWLWLMSSLVRISGTVVYRDSSCVVELCKDFGPYYYSLIPKYRCANPQRYKAHVTVVRKFEAPNELFQQKLFEGASFFLDYSPKVWYSYPYYFLECQSVHIEQLRTIYGLKPHRFDNCYHITIGNNKNNDSNNSDAY